MYIYIGGDGYVLYEGAIELLAPKCIRIIEPLSSAGEYDFFRDDGCAGHCKAVGWRLSVSRTKP